MHRGRLRQDRLKDLGLNKKIAANQPHNKHPAGHYRSHQIRVVQQEGDPMSFKFSVGQEVEYTPNGKKQPGSIRL